MAERTDMLKKLLTPSMRSVVKIVRARAFELLGSDRYSYPALSSMDKWLIKVLPPSGVFLEIGANDGFSQSNTYYLGRHGWTGILVEPLPSQFRICQKHRKEAQCFKFACVGPGGPDELELVNRGLMTVGKGQLDPADEHRRAGGVTETVVAKTATLSDLIIKSGHRHLDFVSIDVEGAELHVLRGLDLTRHCPDFMLVETAQPDAVADVLRPHLQLGRKLTGHDYLFCLPHLYDRVQEN